MNNPNNKLKTETRISTLEQEKDYLHSELKYLRGRTESILDTNETKNETYSLINGIIKIVIVAIGVVGIGFIGSSLINLGYNSAVEEYKNQYSVGYTTCMDEIENTLIDWRGEKMMISDWTRQGNKFNFDIKHPTLWMTYTEDVRWE